MVVEFRDVTDIRVDEPLKYMEIPIVILDKKTKTLHNKVVGLVNA